MYFLIIISIGIIVLSLIIGRNEQIRKEDKDDIGY